MFSPAAAARVHHSRPGRYIPSQYLVEQVYINLTKLLLQSHPHTSINLELKPCALSCVCRDESSKAGLWASDRALGSYAEPLSQGLKPGTSLGGFAASFGFVQGRLGRALSKHAHTGKYRGLGR